MHTSIFLIGSTMGKIIELTDSNFDEIVLQSTVPVLVDFWSPQCGPCRLLVPILDALADEYEDDCVIAKFNVFDGSAIPARYGVEILPTLLFFSQGNVVQRLVGVHPREKLQDILDSM